MRKPAFFSSLTWLAPPRSQAAGLVALLWAHPGIAQPALTPVAHLSFGKVLENASPGTTLLSPLGLRSTSGGTSLFGGTPSALVLQVSGPVGHAFALEGLPVSLTLAGPGSTVTVDTWTSDQPGGAFTGTFGATPTTLHLGATLRLPASPQTGAYGGSVSLQVRDTTNGQASTPTAFTLAADLGLALSGTVQSNLDFGKIVGGPSGTATMNPDGTLVLSNGLFRPPSAPISAGVIRIQGTPNAPYTITLPPSASLTGPGTALALDHFTASAIPATQLDASGTATVRVGGQAHIGSNQARGTYTSTFTVTVAYN